MTQWTDHKSELLCEMTGYSMSYCLVFQGAGFNITLVYTSETSIICLGGGKYFYSSVVTNGVYRKFLPKNLKKRGNFLWRLFLCTLHCGGYFVYPAGTMGSTGSCTSIFVSWFFKKLFILTS